jgi:hypothetical protein
MGRAKRPGVSVETELDDGYAALGFARTIGRDINTDWYLEDVSNLAYSAMNVDFELVVAAAASKSPNNFRHVYEPGHIGNPTFKLWEMKFYGRGRKKEVSWEWKMSMLPILTPEQRALDSTDAMSKLKDDPELLEDLSQERYVFRMQAPVMEYGMHVTVKPVFAKALFIPTWKKTKARKNKKGVASHDARHFRLEKFNYPDFTYRNPQDPSGNRGGTVGSFTALWVSYWNGGGAEETWDTMIAPRIQGGLTKGIDGELKKMSKRRKTGMSFTTFNSTHAAMENGTNLAHAFMRGKSRSYKQASKYIEKHGAFGGDRVL